jgi:hypothetical protein
MTAHLRDRRRGRRVLAVAALVFVVGNFVGGLLLDYRWPDIRFPELGTTFRLLAGMGRSPEVVFLGSSRMAGAASPHVIDPLLRSYTRLAPRTFNAAVNAGDSLVDEYVFGRMLERGVRPSVLVVEVSAEHLNRRCPLLGQQVIRLMTWPDLPSYLPDAAIYTRMMRLVSSRLTPLYFHRYQIRKRLFGYPSQDVVVRGPAPDQGPDPNPSVSELPPAAVNLEPAEGPPPQPDSGWCRGPELSPLQTAALERLLARARAAGVFVILANSPATSGQRAILPPAVNDDFRAYVRSLEERFGCRFVDFCERVPDDRFYDPIHVNHTGAKYFSHVFTRDVLIPVWRELHPGSPNSPPAHPVAYRRPSPE